MSSNQRQLLLFGTASALRLVLFLGFPSLPDFLTGRVEISTPVTSFKRLQEGLFLYTHNVSPYDGGVFYQAPLLLPTFAIIPQAALPFVTPLLFIFLDLLCAHALMRLAESGVSGNERLFKSPRRDLRWSSIAIGAAYLFNPLTVASCLGRTTSIFTNCAILFATLKAVEKKYSNSMMALALASYLSLYPVLLLPPLMILSYDQRQRDQDRAVDQRTFTFISSGIFLGAFAVLILASIFVTGGLEFIASTYGNHLLVADLTPNIGLWWYFFIEMFDSFREFFLGVFWLHLASYVAGFCIRIRRQPLFIIAAMTGIFSVFKPYPAISDASLFLALLPLYAHVFPLMRYSFFAVAAMLYAVLLGPAFYYLWIYAGSGNANFFYAITLVWSLSVSIVAADAVWAVLRDEWEVDRPEMKGKFIKQI